jgi:hypothetical protein
MRSTPRHETITLGGVTETPQPHGQNNPASQWHPEGAFYLNQMQSPPPGRKPWPAWLIALIVVGALIPLAIAGAVLAAVDSDPKAVAEAAASDTDGPGQPHPWTPKTEAADTPKALTVKLGETLVYTASGFGTDDEVHYTLTAGKAITKTKYGTRPEKGQFFALAAAVNVLKGSAYVYGGDFALVTTDGTVYEANMAHAVDGGLEGVEIRAGQKVSGLVVWDIPAGVQVGAKVELRAGGPGGNQGFWQLP